MAKRARECLRRGERNREKKQTHEDGARVMHIETRRGRAKRGREKEKLKRQENQGLDLDAGSSRQQHREGQGLLEDGFSKRGTDRCL